MTKPRPRGEKAKEQSERFQKKVSELIDAGELNPAAADAALDRIVKGATLDT